MTSAKNPVISVRELSDIAHAIRTPLHVLNIFLKQAATLDDSEKFRNYYDAASRSLDKLMNASQALDRMLKR